MAWLASNESWYQPVLGGSANGSESFEMAGCLPSAWPQGYHWLPLGVSWLTTMRKPAAGGEISCMAAFIWRALPAYQTIGNSQKIVMANISNINEASICNRLIQ